MTLTYDLKMLGLQEQYEHCYENYRCRKNIIIFRISDLE